MGESGRRRLIVETEMNSLVGAKSCRSCEWRGKFAQDPGILFCRRYPPQIYSMPMQTPAGVVQWTMNASYPTVNPDLPCGEYERNAAHSAEEIAEASKGMTAQ